MENRVHIKKTAEENRLTIKGYNKKFRAAHAESCKAYGHKYYIEHKAEMNLSAKRNREAHKEERRLYAAKYCADHKTKLQLYNKQYRDTHRKECQIYKKIYRKAHAEATRASYKKAMQKQRSTVGGRLNHRMGTAIYYSLNGEKHGRRWETLTGYTAEDLRKHLESQFKEGMTWDNYGKWHIDHIIPLSRLYIDGTDDPTFKFAWSLSNLQPLWKKDNLKKANKIGVAS